MKKSSIAIILLISFQSWGQASVDSLQALLKEQSLKSVTRIDILNQLSSLTRRNNSVVSRQCANEALALSKEINYRKGEGEAYVNIGLHFHQSADFFNSMECAQRATNIFGEIADKKGLMDSYHLLGSTYVQLKEWGKGEEYLNHSLNLGLELKNNSGIAKAYNSLGVSRLNKREIQEAKKFCLKALDALHADNTDPIKPIILGNLGEIFRTEDTPRAQAYLEDGLQLAESSNDAYARSFIYEKLGALFITKNDLVKAEYYLRKAEGFAKKSGNKTRILGVYMSLMSLKTQMGDTQEYHSYQVKYSQVRDSIFNSEKAQQIAEIEARFETEKKEKAIQLLQQEKEIQEIWQNILIVGSVLVILGSYLIYLLQRSRALKTKKLLETQRLLNDKLTEVDKLKSSFFANISHEFRTPLTLILAPLENELKKKSSQEVKDNLLLMRRNADRLLDLINQLLDLSKLESGKMNLQVKQGDINQFLSMITNSFDSLAQQKQIEFVQNINITEGEYWYDPDKIEKIIANLLSNAFKYTPLGGTVTTTISTIVNNLTITVSDTGAGIPKEEQTNVFLPFYQTRQTSNYQGTGLGLSLVRELVKLYAGTIDLLSTPGVGTSFSVSIPVDKDSFSSDQIIYEQPGEFISQIASNSMERFQEQNNLTEELLLNGKDSILIVEDNIDMREFMAALLQKNNYAVITANNGQEALPLALKFIPSLILSDLMMPTMDGLEFTKEIKDDERTSHIPVILLTAKNESQTRIDGLKTGADDYLTKPFSPDELLVRISNLIQQRKKLAERFRERILVSASPSNQISLDDKFLNKVKGVIESNLSDYTFTVERLAQEISLSRTQLLRKVKALTGLSPTDFIKDIRLKHAANMITQKVDTITQIGYAVGFNDQSYFTKCFKKQFSVTPTEYSLKESKK